MESKWSMCECVFFAFVVETVIKRLVDCLRSVCLQYRFCCLCRYRILFNDCAPMIVPWIFLVRVRFDFVESNDLFQQIELFLCLIVLLLLLLDWYRFGFKCIFYTLDYVFRYPFVSISAVNMFDYVLSPNKELELSLPFNKLHRNPD